MTQPRKKRSRVWVPPHARPGVSDAKLVETALEVVKRQLGPEARRSRSPRVASNAVPLRNLLFGWSETLAAAARRLA